jgi:uncharacterized membrane protein
MNERMQSLSERLLKKSFETLTRPEQEVIRRIADRMHVSRNVNQVYEQQMTFGQRLADQIAAFGGSWTFIIIFGSVLLLWIILNSVILLRVGKPFDPFPYIFLNLILSMLAAIQAPVIMMSQNRQAVKDRLDATHDYEVNLKAELEIMELHQKVDMLRDEQMVKVIAAQEDQIRLLRELLDGQGKQRT